VPVYLVSFLVQVSELRQMNQNYINHPPFLKVQTSFGSDLGCISGFSAFSNAKKSLLGEGLEDEGGLSDQPSI